MATHPHHHHSEVAKKNLLNRMSRIVGHASSVKTMIEDDRDCAEVLIQIAAVRAALNNVGKLLLDDHIKHCVVEASHSDEAEKQKVLDELTDAIDKFVR
ncbi:metal-sensing transcriptional repressor [Eubacteriales bacterium OttesenSCG-928-K08]|nr:metal-sensing transcriptional repressor [Eubacteriales bacterium OttesenSCG-928-K08]